VATQKAPRTTTITFERSTRVAAPAEEVWRSATTPAGINDEFKPWMRMTVPRKLRAMSLDDVELGVQLGRSWVLLLGVVPFEYDDLVLVERGPGFRFLERSSTISARMWQHERTVVPSGSECAIVDRVVAELRPAVTRVPGAAAVFQRVVAAIFAHRHRKLAAMYDTTATPAPPT
jgi:ligand-binding SRPBCC domain-containing protein